MQNYGWYLQLVELIPRRPKQLNIKIAQWMNTLQNSGCDLQLRRLRCISQGVQERLILLGWCDKTKFEGIALKQWPFI